MFNITERVVNRRARHQAPSAALLRRSGRALAATGMIAVASLPVAAPADAALRPCRAPEFAGFPASDHQSWCAKVAGLSRGQVLRVRTAPSTSAPIAYTLRNGSTVEVDGAISGDPVGPRRYRIWAKVYDPGRALYVSDWYLDSGSPRVWIPQIHTPN